MALRVALISFILLNAVNAQGQLFPYKKGKLWGYADSTGKMVLEPIYRVAGKMEQGKAVVMLFNSPEYLLMDDKGNYLSAIESTTLKREGLGSIIGADYLSTYYFRDSLLFSKDERLKHFLLSYPVFSSTSSLYLTTSNFASVINSPYRNRETWLQKGDLILTKNPNTSNWCYLVAVYTNYPNKMLYFFDNGEWINLQMEIYREEMLTDSFKAKRRGSSETQVFRSYPFSEISTTENSEPRVLQYRNMKKKKWLIRNIETKSTQSFSGFDTIYPNKGGGLLASEWKRKDTVNYFIHSDLTKSKLPFNSQITHCGFGLFRIEDQGIPYLANINGDTLLQSNSELSIISSWYAQITESETHYSLIKEGGTWQIKDSCIDDFKTRMINDKTLVERHNGENYLQVWQLNSDNKILRIKLSGREYLTSISTPNGCYYSAVDREDIKLLNSQFSTVFSFNTKNKTEKIEYVSSGVFRFQNGLDYYYFNNKGIKFWNE